ncbi:uncharacterized protein LOC125043551 isoform X2 [Penaeus chinensis]|uniref:uncharacterized protein LOC125043551 isoform X2 n=1 Tax=Penaeus chinensis TaxID=139456 RepID=UPI001FB57922|nr:uncharacterized protein LOC125043551 isoform X2 [Penaeus chinensis]
MEGRRTLSLAAVVIALQVVMATASQNVTSEEVISRQKRFIYIPLTDVFSYNQIVTIGFALLLTVIVAALAYLSEDASGYEASTGYLTPHRRVIDRNGAGQRSANSFIHSFKTNCNILIQPLW